MMGVKSYISGIIRGFIIVSAGLALSACASHFPVSEQGQTRLEINDLTITRITAQNVRSLNTPDNRQRASRLPAPPPIEYRVGPGDVVSIIVWDYPELTIPTGPQRSAVESGAIVRTDGTLFFPYVGSVQAAGLTSGEIRETLTRDLARFIPEPQVEVRVVRFASQSVTITGSVIAPQSMTLTDEPLRLVDAIARAGGLTEDANVDVIRLDRGGEIYTLAYQTFLDGLAAELNIRLSDGDIISIPRRKPQNVFLLGQVSRPGLIPLPREGLSLTAALTSSGGLDETRADARGVFVFRGSVERIDVFQLDVSNALAYVIGDALYLEADDVVFVTTAPVDRWNDLISDLLPSLTFENALQQRLN